VLVRLPKLLIALALAISIGLHWTVLQMVAWTGMVISYSQGAPLTQAVVKTFDGNHPCNLCKQIAKGKKSEKKVEYQFDANKVKFAHASIEFIFSAPPLFWEVRAVNDAADLLTHAPPVPPPRSLLA
jgi:hypothetical protein